MIKPSRGAKTKGYIKNLKTGATKKFTAPWYKKEKFNPNTLKYDRQSNISALDSPGVNYPVLAYGSTKERTLEVALFLYGEATPRHITFLENLLPTDKGSVSGVSHPLALFVLGGKVKKVAVTDVSVEETMWDSSLNCTKATVTLKMVEVRNE